MARPEPVLALTDRVLYLGAIENFVGLSVEQLELVAERAEERFLKTGEVLTRAGCPVPAAWLVVDGGLRAVGPGVDRENILPRQGVGLVQIYARSAQGIDLVATQDSHVLEWDEEAILDSFEDDFAIYVHQLRQLTRVVLDMRMRVAPGQYLAPGACPECWGDRSLDLVERIGILRGTGFTSTSLDALADLAAQLGERRADPGTVLWRAGDPSGQVLLLIQGAVRCVLPDGLEFRCGTGYPLGNAEALAQRPHWYDAVVETPLLGLETESETMLDVLEDHLDMALELLSAVARNLMGLRELERAREVGAKPAS